MANDPTATAVTCRNCGGSIFIDKVTADKWKTVHECSRLHPAEAKQSAGWHTYANVYDVFLGDGNVVVTWHGRGPDDRDLIEWAFQKGRQLEREHLRGNGG